jgi:hypothetical protein
MQSKKWLNRIKDRQINRQRDGDKSIDGWKINGRAPFEISYALCSILDYQRGKYDEL